MFNATVTVTWMRILFFQTYVLPCGRAFINIQSVLGQKLKEDLKLFPLFICVNMQNRDFVRHNVFTAQSVHADCRFALNVTLRATQPCRFPHKNNS